MKILFIAFALLFFMKCKTPSGFEGISINVQKSCSKKTANAKKQLDHKLRMELYNEGKLNFINLRNDTVFVLSGNYLESGNHKGMLWNSKGSSEYYFRDGKLGLLKFSSFTPLTVRLVQEWNETEIRKEEKDFSKWTHPGYVTAYQVILVKGKPSIKCMDFQEFIDPRRDSAMFTPK